ncbi:MAG: hypothetical protein QM756_15290 [Polyangiaceae bacterium]
MANTRLWVALAGVSLSLTAAAPALACMNGAQGHHLRGPDDFDFDYREDNRITHLKLAEDALRASNYSLAAAELDKLVDLKAGTKRTKSRAARVAALVTVRTLGQWPLAKGSELNDAEARSKALKKAVKALRQRVVEDANDVARQSDLAEGLAAVPEHRAEARRLLEKLAAKNLVTSAHAYAVLARLRAKAGDTAGAEVAQDRCKRLDESEHACGEAPKA